VSQSYFGIEVENIVDVVKRNAVVTMIRTTGQTPKQLFSSPHQLPSPRLVSNVKRTGEKVLFQTMFSCLKLNYFNYLF